MPNIEDQLQKKKVFKKKTYRSYLSLDETLDDVEQEKSTVTHSTTRPPVTHGTEPQVNLSPKVTFSPEVQNSPQVTIAPQVQKSPEGSRIDSHSKEATDLSSSLKIEIPQVSLSPKVINSPEVTFSPQVQMSPQVIFSPEAEVVKSVSNSTTAVNSENSNSNNSNTLDIKPQVSLSPEVKIESNVEALKNSVENHIPQILQEIEPQVTFAPEVNLSPKAQNSPQVIFSPQVDFSSQKPDKKSLGQLKTPKKITSSPKEENSDDLHQHAALDNLIVHTTNLFKGFTRVPNSILQVLISGELTKHELQTLAVVLRLTIGFNRDEAPISLGVIQSLTGIQSSRISAALNVLIEKNLIKRKSGSINSPNLISVVYSDETSKVNIQPKVQKSPQVTIAPQVQNSPETSGEKITVDLGLESHLQYIYKINKDTLSLSDEFQNKYLSTMLKKEKERVFNLLQELKQTPISDIETVFTDVFENKKDTLGQPINSEIGYLESCFFKHSNWLKTRQNEKQKSEESKRRAESAIKAEELQQQQEAEKWNQVVQAFNQKFKTEEEQNAIIEKYACKMTGPYSSIAPARRSFAIKEWFEELIAAKG